MKFVVKPLRSIHYRRLQKLYYMLRFPHLYWQFRKFRSYTMTPRLPFIKNLDLAFEYRHVPGVVVECGTWRGGMIAGIAAILGNNREYYLFDSFEGLPEAKPIDGENAQAWQNDTQSPYFFDNCKAEMAEAERAMKLSGVTNFTIVKGWFDQTLPNFSDDKPIAILRLDGDWYESTMTCLENLYPKLVPGGIIIIDDYHTWDGCSRAIHDYLTREKLNDRVCQWRNDIAYIIKRGEKFESK
jgi:O-methyltransferase